MITIVSDLRRTVVHSQCRLTVLTVLLQQRLLGNVHHARLDTLLEKINSSLGARQIYATHYGVSMVH